MRSPSVFLAVAALMVTPAGTFAQTWVTVEASAIAPPARDLAMLRAEHVAALNAADPGRLRALYAPDAIAVLDDGVVLRGRDEIGRHFRDACAARPEDTSVTLAPQHFSVDDRVASETGSFSESRHGEDPGAATGVYVTIYTRGADGDWRIAMELRTRGRDKQIVRW